MNGKIPPLTALCQKEYQDTTDEQCLKIKHRQGETVSHIQDIGFEKTTNSLLGGGLLLAAATALLGRLLLGLPLAPALRLALGLTLRTLLGTTRTTLLTK